ncbi:hypothetical protein ACFU5Z_20775 [Streptomyces sp. NPDC057521]|uniref:hypothetical protein n=1 Tax=Streptomyces sp. NPDC057521 TaxID=3346156 RepID=UPI00367FB17B
MPEVEGTQNRLVTAETAAEPCGRARIEHADVDEGPAPHGLDFERPFDADVGKGAMQLQCRLLHLTEAMREQPSQGVDFLLRKQCEDQLVAGARQGLFAMCDLGDDALGEQVGPHVSVRPGVSGRGGQPQAATTRHRA